MINEISIDLYLQNFKHLAQQNLEKMGEKKIGLVVFPLFPPAAGQWWDAHRRERPGFVPGWRQVLPGVGWGGEKLSPTLLSQAMSMTSTFPGPLPEQPQVRLCMRTLPHQPQPQCAVQINQQFTGGMAIKGNSETPNNFLKPKNIFHGVEHFSSVLFFKCKSSDVLFKQKQHLGINSGTWVLGGYRYASWILLPLI